MVNSMFFAYVLNGSKFDGFAIIEFFLTTLSNDEITWGLLGL